MMEVDSEQLIFAVEQRNAIYDRNHKDYSNKHSIDQLWEEIAEELERTVPECKSKWTSLRNSYSRHLREGRSKSCSLKGKQKKKWYLADAMTFLTEHVHQERCIGTSNESVENESNIMSPQRIEAVETVMLEGPNLTTNTSSTVSQSAKRPKPSDLLVGPMIEFLNSKTMKTTGMENSNSLFMKCMLTDLNNLTRPNQRKFRKLTSDLMLDLQEKEESEYKT